jgi:hypothetical protein
MKIGRPTRFVVLSSVMAALTSLVVQTGANAPRAGVPAVAGDTRNDLLYTPKEPCRIVDTRVAGGPFAAGETRSFWVSGEEHESQGGGALGCGVPFGQASAVLNIVAVSPAGQGHLRAWAYATPPVAPPNASVLNFAAIGLNIANGLPVPLCDPAVTSCPYDFQIFASHATHVVIDVLGYFGAYLNPLQPSVGEKSALEGTQGSPGGANRYVTNADPRNSNARTPLAHGASAHDPSVITVTGPYSISRHNAAGTSSVLMGTTSGRACFLTEVSSEDTEDAGEWADCNILATGGNWQLVAGLGTTVDADVWCQARCIAW